jgi:hypothetical protein
VITPNADQIHDYADIRFDLVKVNAPPEVSIHSLQGGLVKELVRQDTESYIYRWDGTDRTGALVPPGVYGCRIQVHAEIGAQTIYRVISVVY